MIVRCPECDTAFNLPDSKVTTKGSKVRCSRCSHTFRVRLSDEGTAEAFYKNEGVADPPTQELGEHLFEESVAEELEDAFEQSVKKSDVGQGPGVEVDQDEEEVDEEAARRTQMGIPVQSREETPNPFQSKSAQSDFIPFPLAGKAQKAEEPEEPAEEGIDLFEGEEPLPPESEATEDRQDPFAGAFEENAAPQEEALQAQSGPGPAGPRKFQPPPSAAPAAQTTPREEKPDPFAGTGGEFGDPEDLVDPDFGKDTPQFDPNTGQVDKPAPAPAAAPTPNRPAAAQPRPQPAPEPVPQATRTEVEDWDVAPHKIGGGGFQKFSNFLLLLLIVLIAFVGVVAGMAGGFVDFTKPQHMLDVAFKGTEFEPRDDWKSPPPPPPAPVPEEPVEVEDVFATVISLDKRGKEQVLVVRGTARNATSEEIPKASIRVMILDANEKILREQTMDAGRTVPLEDLKALESTADVGGLPFESAKAIPAGGNVEFMAIFSDIPEAVSREERVTYRLEVVEPSS